MLQQISNVLNGIGEFITNIGSIITMIFEGMAQIPKYIKFTITWITGQFGLFFPPVLITFLLLLFMLVACYKIYGRT